MYSQAQARDALEETLSRYALDQVAERLTVDPRTIDRWRRERIPSPGLVYLAAKYLLRDDVLPPTPADFTFADIFAGIGGTRIGVEAAGGKCVFTCEWDRFCRQTYRANFPSTHPIEGDIRALRVERLPEHDLLVAGFPCQPFSVAGVSKKNSLGRAHGFACATQGTLFFDIAQILEAKRPTAFLLENVKNLTSHDRGRTFEVIVRTLHDELGYEIDYKIIDARHLVPQHRERVFIAGFRAPTAFSWDQVRIIEKPGPFLERILHPADGSEQPEKDYTIGALAEVNRKYVLSKKLWQYLRDYAAKHKEKGNGFGFGLFGPQDVARTLSARYFKDGSEILISRGTRRNPRRLTPRECARLMGFPDSFSIPVSDTQAYRQFGNSVVVPVVEAVAKAMYPHLMALKQVTDRRQVAMAV